MDLTPIMGSRPAPLILLIGIAAGKKKFFRQQLTGKGEYDKLMWC